MKNTASLLAALFACISLFGQTKDTTFLSIGQEPGTHQQQRFVDQYDYVFGTLDTAIWMFRWDMTGGFDNGAFLNLSTERKLTPAFSLQIAYGLGGTNRYDSLSPLVPFPDPDTLYYPLSEEVFSHRFGLQSRWYYDMAQRVRDGRSANNFSGNYLGLEVAYTAYGLGLSGEEARFASEQITTALRWGVQRRLFRYSFIDVSFGLGARRSSGFDPGVLGQHIYWDFFANTQFSVGLALYTPKTAKRDMAYCDVLRCFREESQMFKIDLYNLLKIRDKNNMKGTASFAWERKIGQSSFSVELLGYVSARKEETVAGDYQKHDYSGWGFGGHVQPRFYYSLKKRIAKGKSGNNLSGAYFALQTAYKQDFEKYTNVSGNFKTEFDGTDEYLSIGPLWGIQYRLFKNGFIDLNFGMVTGPERKSGVQDGNDYTYKQTYAEFTGSLRIGLAF